MKKLFKVRYVSILLVATFAVAAPRYMGVFGMIVGNDLSQVQPFIWIETFSGLAMGALEALVLEYIAHRLRRIPIFTPYWWAATIIAVVILITFPPVTAPYMAALMNNVSIVAILNGQVQLSVIFWSWTFLVAMLIPLIVAAIGIVRDDGDEELEVSNDWIPVEVKARTFLDQWHRDRLTGSEPTPPEFVHYFCQRTGIEVTPEEADQFIIDWRSINGRRGARPSVPSLPVPVNGQG